jgi:UDP-2,3-diacylglucosamine pyrophosphatase LpxH
VSPERLTIIGDLHLSGGPSDDFHEGEALVGFLDALRERMQTAAGGVALVVLGDLLSFPELPVGRELETATREHASVFDALGRLTAAGVDLEIVVGNHDADLLRPDVQAQLRWILGRQGGERRGQLRVHPWIYHVPGLVYAEHGQQHHDINRMPELLRPETVERGESVPLPLGTQLVRSKFELEQALGAPSRLRKVALALRAAWRFARLACRAVASMQRESRHPPTPGQLTRYAKGLDLPEEALRALATLSLASPLGVLRRLLRRRPAGSYMVEAAAAVHRALLRFGVPARFYVFGHTHLAADIPLDDSAGPARYLNAGTWSVLRPSGADGLAFVEIAAGPGGTAEARLEHWRGRRRGVSPPERATSVGEPETPL